jgi:hypothetical protein
MAFFAWIVALRMKRALLIKRLIKLSQSVGT